MNYLEWAISLISPETQTIGNLVINECIGWIIPAIGFALTAASTWYAQDQAAKAESKNKKLLEEQQSSIDAWYKNESRPFLETESGKSIQAMLQGQYSKIMEKSRNNAIAGGATAESDIAMKEKVLDSYNNTILGAAASGENRRLAANSQYQDQLTNILNQKLKTNSQESQNWIDTINSISSLLTSAGAMYGEGAFVA
jgi:hypothetical protein